MLYRLDYVDYIDYVDYVDYVDYIGQTIYIYIYCIVYIYVERERERVWGYYIYKERRLRLRLRWILLSLLLNRPGPMMYDDVRCQFCFDCDRWTTRYMGLNYTTRRNCRKAWWVANSWGMYASGDFAACGPMTVQRPTSSIVPEQLFMYRSFRLRSSILLPSAVILRRMAERSYNHPRHRGPLNHMICCYVFPTSVV